MTVTEERPTGDVQLDLDHDLGRVGIVRRMFQARRWYGADWWFVAISTALVMFFISVAIAPGVFAPHDPREEAGPRTLAPGENPPQEVFLSLVGDDITSIADLEGEERVSFGVVIGEPTSDIARDEADLVTEELQAAGGEGRVRLRIERFDTLPEMLDALVAGDIVAAGHSSAALGSVDGYPGVEVTGPVEAASVGAGDSFILGTNQLGQDMLSRIIWGTRVAMQVGLGAAAFALVVGAPLGLLSGYLGGRFDRAMSLLMDSLYAFPGLILAISIAAVLGPSLFNVILAIAVLYVPTYFRIVRAQTLSTKQELYVEAARSIGASNTQILRKYIYPNVIPSVAIIFSVNVADGILTGAGLSFLGLGLPPDTPDWGIDLARGQESIQSAWWLITFPGLAVMLVVLAFSMMGEGLVEIFNPKLRKQ